MFVTLYTITIRYSFRPVSKFQVVCLLNDMWVNCQPLIVSVGRFNLVACKVNRDDIWQIYLLLWHWKGWYLMACDQALPAVGRNPSYQQQLMHWALNPNVMPPYKSKSLWFGKFLLFQSKSNLTGWFSGAHWPDLIKIWTTLQSTITTFFPHIFLYLITKRTRSCS